MKPLYIYNIINGIFYLAYGLWGLIVPQRLLAFFDIEIYGAYALHNIRAMWVALFVLGALILWKARSHAAITLGLTIALVTGGFAAGRLLGLAFDGMDEGSGVTYYEISFELIWMALGLFLVKRASQKQA
jgi:hypothetical protein